MLVSLLLKVLINGLKSDIPIVEAASVPRCCVVLTCHSVSRILIHSGQLIPRSFDMQSQVLRVQSRGRNSVSVLIY